MKDVEEIFRLTIGIPFSEIDRVPVEKVKDCMFAAMKETIVECSKRAVAELVFLKNGVQTLQVDKQSILKLIDELK